LKIFQGFHSQRRALRWRIG